MHQQDNPKDASVRRAAPKERAKSAAEQKLDETIAREAREDRCYRCFHSPCGCPPGFGLNRTQAEIAADFSTRSKGA